MEERTDFDISMEFDENSAVDATESKQKYQCYPTITGPEEQKYLEEVKLRH